MPPAVRRFVRSAAACELTEPEVAMHQRRSALLAIPFLAVLLLVGLRPAAASPEPQPPLSIPVGEAAPPNDGSLQLDDPAEPHKAIKTRTGREEDHIRALALFAAARVAEQKQDYAAALKNYQRAFRFDRDALLALREIVPLAFNLDRQVEGVRYALLLAERDPADPALLRRLAIYLTEEGDSKRALKLYEQALALQEKAGDKPAANTVLMWMEMGRLNFLAKNYDQSAHFFSLVTKALASPKEFGLTPAIEKAILNKGDLTYQFFGESFLEAGRPDEALAAFEKAQQLKADDARDLYNRARVDLKKKQPAQAIAKLEKYLDKHASSQGAEAYQAYVDALNELGQESQASERLEKHRAADPKNLALGYFVAERYRKAGQLDKAEPIYAALIAEQEKRPPVEAFHGLIDVYRQQKNAAKVLGVLGQTVGRGGTLGLLGESGKTLLADTELCKAIVAEAKKQLDADPKQLSYGQALGAALVAVNTKEFETGSQLFEAALKADGAKSPEAMLNWGLELLMANQYDPAIKVFERGLNEKVLPEKNAAIYFYLAGALEMAGRTDEALERAKQAAELEKESARFANRTGWIQFHAKRLDAARQSYLALLDKYDKEHDKPEVREVLRDARLVLSNIAVMENKNAESEEWLEQVLDEFPEDAGALNDLGYLWADGNKHLELALQMIQTAVSNEPKNMAYRDSLGWVLYRLGQYDAAVAELQVAASVEDPDAVVLDHLAEAQLKSGDVAGAKATWERSAAAHDKDNAPEKAAKIREKIKQAEPAPAGS